jgi:50S ribosomal subunit-associated GTPase HflX
LFVKQADLLVVVHDVSNRYIREAVDKKILRLLCLYQARVPSVLVLNKIDTIPRYRTLSVHESACQRSGVGSMGSIGSELAKNEAKLGFSTVK